MSAAESSSVGLGPSAYRAIVVEEAPLKDKQINENCFLFLFLFFDKHFQD